MGDCDCSERARKNVIEEFPGNMDAWPPARQLPNTIESRQTCGGCPEQYEGRLIDGRFFYFRYRHGRAELGIGATLEDAVRSSAYQQVLIVNDRLSGMFDSEDSRDEVFKQLLHSYGTDV